MQKVILLFALTTGLFAADPSVGTWKFNPSKSTGPELPKGDILVFEERGGSLHVAATGTRADGSPSSYTTDWPKAGGTGQVSGNPFADGMSVKVANDHTRDVTFTKDGKTVRSIHMVIAQDGKSMIITATGTSAGKPLSAPQKLVYEKQ